MAVMARMVGLPSRYIEGYAAVPDSDGIARVTQRNAHAWAEIYFSGFGWLSFDATPGYGTENTSDDGNLPDNPPAASPSPSPTPTPEADAHSIPVSGCVADPVIRIAGRNAELPLRPNRRASPTTRTLRPTPATPPPTIRRAIPARTGFGRC